MKIYDVPNFPNPLRVRIALAEKGALSHAQFVDVDVMNGEHRTPDFLEKNPTGAIPVLELDDGTYISECSAIIEYIDHTFDGPSLTGDDPKHRAIVTMQQRRMESMVLDAVAAYFHHATDGLGPALETNQNPAWGEQQKQLALKGLDYANQVLAQQAYIAGEQFSVADITLHAGLVFAAFANIEIPQQLTHLKAWQDKVSQRPSFQS
ncbi:glutathione S-transferase family protein [Aliiglaciecola sp.]|nr:glutathione S-transferase family protein [Aliiglaciecola sp.]